MKEDTIMAKNIYYWSYEFSLAKAAYNGNKQRSV